MPSYRTESFLAADLQTDVIRWLSGNGITGEYRSTHSIDFDATQAIAAQFVGAFTGSTKVKLYAVDSRGVSANLVNADGTNAGPEPSTVTFEIWFTRAPEAYDGFGTFALPVEPGTFFYDRQGNELRKVAVLPRNREWQLTRYASGMYPSLTENEVQDIANGD